MGELNEHDMDRLFRTAGHLRPTSDLTDRIMARVAVTPVIRATEVKPLIGRWGWAGILFSVVALLGFLLGTGHATTTATSPVSGMLQAMLEGLSLPAGNWPALLIGASACLLLFTVLDRMLAMRMAAPGEHL